MPNDQRPTTNDQRPEYNRKSSTSLAVNVLGKLVAVIILIVGLTQYAILVHRLFPALVIDDAFITYRYAQNWAHGLGATWNAIDSRVEGYSAPLYMAILALGSLFNANLPIFSKVICLISGILTLIVFCSLISRLTRSFYWAAFGTGVLALHPCLAIWSIGGMETALYTLLLTTSALALYETDGIGTKRAWKTLGFLLVLLALCRTEGLFATAAFALCVLLESPREGRLRPSLIIISVVLLAMGAHLAIRYAYYGKFFPLPVYEKGRRFIQEKQVGQFIFQYWPQLLLTAGVAFHSISINTGSLLRYNFFCIILLALIVMQVDPIMSDYQRYLFPVVPLLILGAVLGLRAVLQRAADPVLSLAFLVVLALVQGRQILGALVDAEVAKIERYSAGVMASHVTLALWLRVHAPYPTALVSAADCGVIPYYSGLRVIDHFGLNDSHIAAHGLDPNYVFGRRPEYIVITPLARDNILRSDSRLDQQYSLLGNFPGIYLLQLYGRKDIAPSSK